MLIAVAALVAAIIHFVLVSLIQADSLRGASSAIALFAHAAAWSPIVPEAISSAVFWGSIVLLALAASSRKPKGGSTPWIMGGVLAFFSASAMVSLVLGSPGMNLSVRIGLLACLTAIVSSQFSDRDVRLFFDGIVLTAVFQGVCGLLQFFVTKAPVLWGYPTIRSGPQLFPANPFFGGSIDRIQGTMGSWIPFAVLLALALLIVMNDKGRYRPALRVVVIGLCAVCLALAGSRSALIGLGAGLVVSATASRSISAPIRNTILVAGSGVAGLLAVPQLLALFDEVAATGSFQNRLGNVAALPTLLRRSAGQLFFGSGAGSEAGLFAQGVFPDNGFNVVDNQLITTLTTQGLLGLAVLIVVLAASFRRADGSTRALLAVMFVALFSFDYFRTTPMLVLVIAFLCIPVKGAASSKLPQHAIGAQDPNEGPRGDNENLRPSVIRM